VIVAQREQPTMVDLFQRLVSRRLKEEIGLVAVRKE
jgi:hypothetical protein